MKTWIRNILVAAAVLLTALSLSACGTKTVDLNKYVKIETSGYNGAGTATVSFDEEKIAKDHDKHIKLSKEMSYLAQYVNVSPAVGMMKDCVSGRLDQTSGLSNGDKITFRWTCSDGMAKQHYGVNLKYSDITVKVKGLDKVETFDPFDFITVEFTGTEPAGEMNYNADLSHPEVQYLRFEADKTSGLSNGEKITVSVSVNGDPETFMAKFGKLPKDNEKVYTVSGLSKVVSSSSEIDETCLSAMKQQAEDVFRATYAKGSDVYTHLTSLEYVGMTFRMRKSWDAGTLYPGSDINVCGLVYKVGVHCDEKHTGWFDDHDAFDIEFYSPVLFTYLTKDENGNCSVDLMDYRTTDHSFATEGETNYFFNAYRTTDELIENLLTCYRDNYYTESAIA